MQSFGSFNHLVGPTNFFSVRLNVDMYVQLKISNAQMEFE